ncbi:hypothetical protein [Psychrobacillus sp. FSL H8-0484]|uniref:hypothetical protein n=1 Tax=Psychrobacillus sp. FSL H8-0484 TaxID=2921390 RepID=UPI004046BC7E
MYPYSNEFFSFPHGPVCGTPYLYCSDTVRYFPYQMPFFYEHSCISKAEVDLKNLNRLLWEQHVYWTRMTITSLVFNLPDLQPVQERLLRNAPDMGNSIRPFYGDQIADRYTALIKEHLIIAAELVTAAIKGDTKTAEEKEKEWYRNADDIVKFLSSINPYINREELKKMFYSHLALTKNEAVNMIQKNYKGSIDVFDRIEKEALEMADMISKAIIMQFPQSF